MLGICRRRVWRWAGSRLRQRASSTLVAAPLLALSASVAATPQAFDRLRFQGQDYVVQFPVPSPLPSNRVVVSGAGETPCADACSANWRGYSASWAVTDGKLWLRDYVAGGCRTHQQGLEAVRACIDGSAQALPLEASWFSGAVWMFFERFNGMEPQGLQPSFRCRISLTVTAGRVEGQRIEANPRFLAYIEAQKASWAERYPHIVGKFPDTSDDFCLERGPDLR